MSFGAFSQDTGKVWVPRADLKAALARLEQAKVDQVELGQVKAREDSLLSILKLRGQTVSLLEKSLINKDLIITNHEKQYRVLALNLKRQKKKTIGVGILAFLSFSALLLTQ